MLKGGSGGGGGNSSISLEALRAVISRWGPVLAAGNHGKDS